MVPTSRKEDTVHRTSRSFHPIMLGSPPVAGYCIRRPQQGFQLPASRYRTMFMRKPHRKIDQLDSAPAEEEQNSPVPLSAPAPGPSGGQIDHPWESRRRSGRKCCAVNPPARSSPPGPEHCRPHQHRSERDEGITPGQPQRSPQPDRIGRWPGSSPQTFCSPVPPRPLFQIDSASRRASPVAGQRQVIAFCQGTGWAGSAGSCAGFQIATRYLDDPTGTGD
jgi:hypothetical protein